MNRSLESDTIAPDAGKVGLGLTDQFLEQSGTDNDENSMVAKAPVGRKWRLVVNVDAADHIPDRLPSAEPLSFTAQGSRFGSRRLSCGAGHRIMVNLSSTRRPRWSLVSVSH